MSDHVILTPHRLAGQNRVPEKHIRADLAQQLQDELGDVTPIMAFFQVENEIKFSGHRGANTWMAVKPVATQFDAKNHTVGFVMEADKHPMLIMPTLYEWASLVLRHGNETAHYGGTWIIAFGHPWEDTRQPSSMVMIDNDVDGDHRCAAHLKLKRPAEMMALTPQDLMETVAPAFVEAEEVIKEALDPLPQTIGKLALGERVTPVK